MSRLRSAQAHVAVGLVLVLLWPLGALVAWVLPAFDARRQDIPHRLQPPSLSHPMGTDELGRDLLSRVLYGTALSPGSALLVVCAAGVFGTGIGLLAGYRGGNIDMLLMRLADMFLAFPAVILALLIATLTGGGLGGAIVAISMTLWPAYARLARDHVHVVKQAMFVQAARAQGASPLYLLRRHVLPHTYDLLLVQASLDVAVAVGMVAGLSYIGIGAKIPTPEWGRLILAGYQQGMLEHWWLVVFPTLALVQVCLGCVLISDGLRDWRERR